MVYQQRDIKLEVRKKNLICTLLKEEKNRIWLDH
jgi:hypothetical protein